MISQGWSLAGSRSGSTLVAADCIWADWPNRRSLCLSQIGVSAYLRLASPQTPDGDEARPYRGERDSASARGD